MIKLSFNAQIGKQGAFSGLWISKFTTPEDIMRHSYTQHKAVSGGLYLVPSLSEDEPTNRTKRYWRGSQCVIVDIDNKLLPEEQRTQLTLATLLDNPFIRQYAFFIKPSSSYVPNEIAAWHLFFALDTTVLSWDDYRNLHGFFQNQIGVPLDKATFTPSQAIAGTYWTNLDTDEYPLSWVFVQNDAPFLDAGFIFSMPDIQPQKISLYHDRRLSRVEQELESQTAQRHKKQPLLLQEQVTLEALQFILNTLDNDRLDYDDWLQLWTAAHHGANTEAVAQALITSKGICWYDEAEKQQFLNTFRKHHLRENASNYTVASLFWLAKKRGWLSQSPHDILIQDTQPFYAEHIAQWVEQTPLPHQFLLMSQTGTGKTEAIATLWRKWGSPKTVVFSPSIKLSQELASHLGYFGIKTRCYFNEVEGKSHDTAYVSDVQSYDVLVTTLQSFIRHFRHQPYTQLFQLFVFEECDQLFSQFVLGGHSFYGNHISDKQAHFGLSIIQQILQKGQYVVGLDATMTKNTIDLVQTLKGTSLPCYQNTYTRKKATVTIVPNIESIFALAMQHYQQRQRLVFAVDTAKMAKTIYDMLNLFLPEARKLLIIRETGILPEVNAFIQNPNDEAHHYDMIIYNTAIASGVSVQSVKADALFQVCTYLTPRVHLQLLNRFRQQGNVYLFYGLYDDLYSYVLPEAEYIREGFELELKLADLSNEYALREYIARVRQMFSNRVIQDMRFQKRAPLHYYKQLLEKDGRRIQYYYPDATLSEIYEHYEQYRKALRQKNKALREFLRDHWHEYEPKMELYLNKTLDEKIRLAHMTHYLILQFCNQHIPEDVDTKTLFDIYQKYHRKKYYAYLWIPNYEVEEHALQKLTNLEIPISSIKNIFAKMKMILYIKNFFEHSKIAFSKIPEYLNVFLLNSEIYNSIVARRKRLEFLKKEFSNSQELFFEMLKSVLHIFGLKLKKTDDAFVIANLEEYNLFLKCVQMPSLVF